MAVRLRFRCANAQSHCRPHVRGDDVLYGALPPQSVARVCVEARRANGRHVDAHIEQKTNVGLYSFFSAFLNAPETNANLDFVAVGAPVPRERRSFEWVG